MENLALIARQLQRETEAHEEARKRLQDRHREACDKRYASSNVEGRAAVREFLEPIAKRIEARYGALTSGRSGMDAVEVVKHLKDADPYILALITMKVCLDVLGKDPTPQIQDITTAIGKSVQIELRLTYYAQQEPELYKQVDRYFHKSSGTRQKATVFKLHFNRANIEWENWPRIVNHKVGNWLLQAMNDVTGWVERKVIRQGSKTKTRIGYTREFLAHRDTILHAAESLAFCQWPMLCPPVDWSNDQNGGYLMEQIRQVNPLIRKAGPKVRGRKQGDIPIAMLNSLQHQAYRINRRLFDVADHMYEYRQSVGKFKCSEPVPAPPAPAEDASEEDIKSYKRRRRQIEDDNAQLAQRNWRTTEVMYVARKYVGEERFWMPASFDYRGRVYFLNTALNPQGTDFDKSLLYFADEGPVDEYWLSFHVATTFGLDKETMANRVQWTRDNRSLIERIATDPLRNTEWHTASEPWCFLAAAMEYYDCVISGAKQTSGLPIGIDATCSGLQHLAAMTMDGTAAALVNVTPTPKPADGYLTVAEKAKDWLDAKYHPWMNRKVTKRTVMTTPYGVTLNSARGYIIDQLKEDKRAPEMWEPGVISSIVKAIFQEAMPAVFPGPVAVMKWMKSAARQRIKEGAKMISWTSPSGFVVNQDLRVPHVVRVRTRIMGGAEIDLKLGEGWTDQPDLDHHVSAIAPNVVHSMDAALLHLTFAFWDRPFTVIHDCVLGRSCDMHDMASDIRLHFAEMYKAPVMEQWAEKIGVKLPEGLIKNTLDIDTVNQSDYFFS